MTFHKFLMTSILTLVGLSALLAIAQVWGPLFEWAIFTKLIITFGILIALAAFLLIAKADLGEHKKLKDDNYLD